MKKIVACLCMLALAGCTGTGYVQASAVDSGMRKVCERHDKFIKGELDPRAMSEADKATALRTSDLVIQVLNAASRPTSR